MSSCTCNQLFNTPCKECTQFESIDDYEIEVIEEDDEE